MKYENNMPRFADVIPPKGGLGGDPEMSIRCSLKPYSKSSAFCSL